MHLCRFYTEENYRGNALLNHIKSSFCNKNVISLVWKTDVAWWNIADMHGLSLGYSPALVMELIYLEIIVWDILWPRRKVYLRLCQLSSECSEALCVVLVKLLEQRWHNLRSVQLRVVSFLSITHSERVIFEFLNKKSWSLYNRWFSTRKKLRIWW